MPKTILSVTITKDMWEAAKLQRAAEYAAVYKRQCPYCASVLDVRDAGGHPTWTCLCGYHWCGCDDTMTVRGSAWPCRWKDPSHSDRKAPVVI